MSRSQEFTFSPSLARFAVSSAVYLAQNPRIAALIGACLIFKEGEEGEARILLLRRAPTDSWPLCWENPGGCVDRQDVTLMHAAAREAYEETGLVVKRFTAIVGLGEPPGAGEEGDDDGTGADEGDLQEGIVTFVETGAVWGKLNFLAEVESAGEVTIQEGEHCEYRWVREEEVRRGRFDDGNELIMTSSGVRRSVLQAFKTRMKRPDELAPG